jgi:hypothetical protein
MSSVEDDILIYNTSKISKNPQSIFMTKLRPIDFLNIRIHILSSFSTTNNDKIIMQKEIKVLTYN